MASLDTCEEIFWEHVRIGDTPTGSSADDRAFDFVFPTLAPLDADYGPHAPIPRGSATPFVGPTEHGQTNRTKDFIGHMKEVVGGLGWLFNGFERYIP
jgi:hypothetical protein